MGTLQALVIAGVLALGNDNSASERPAPIEVQDAVKKPVRQDVIAPLRDFIYANYDKDMGVRRRDLGELEQKLEVALKSAGIPEEGIANIKQGKDCKELEKFFDEQGLRFKFLRIFNQSTAFNYELVKIDSTEKKKMELFGITKEYVKLRVVEPELISNSFTYRAQKRNLVSTGISNVHWIGTDMIEIRVNVLEATAKNYYDGEKTKGAGFDAELADPKLLDKYEDKLKLFDRMGSLLHHMAVRDLYKSSKDEADFVKKLTSQFEQDGEVRSVLGLIDDFIYGKEILDKLSTADRRALIIDTVSERENRGILTKMYHRNPLLMLGDTFKIAGNHLSKETVVGEIMGETILSEFLDEIVKDRETFKNIDVSGYDKKNDILIYKQFRLLTADQIKMLSKKQFDRKYEGKSLRDYMQPKVDKLLKKAYD